MACLKSTTLSDRLINIGTVRLESHGKQGGLSDKNHRRVIRTAEAGSGISAGQNYRQTGSTVFIFSR